MINLIQSKDNCVNIKLYEYMYFTINQEIFINLIQLMYGSYFYFYMNVEHNIETLTYMRCSSCEG